MRILKVTRDQLNQRVQDGMWELQTDIQDSPSHTEVRTHTGLTLFLQVQETR